MDLPDNKTTRRAALRQIAGSATMAAGVFPILGQNPPPESHHSAQPVTKQAAKAYRYRFFSQQQLQTLDDLCETIIPTDAHSPGAKAAHVSEYIDVIVADEPEATKQLWREGLATVERMCHEKFARPYAGCSPAQQTEILKELAGDEEPGARRPNDFFAVLKRATVDGYYTSQIGIFQDLQYQGNQAMPGFPGCQLPEIKTEHS